MKITKWRNLLPLLLLLNTSVALADKIDFGLGLSFVDDRSSEALAGAWDLQVGSDIDYLNGWGLGWQLQLTQAMDGQKEFVDETDMAYSSAGLYLTATPYHGWFYLKGGVVNASYQTINVDSHTTGIGFGAGLVVDYPGMRIHLLDFQRVVVGSESFDMYTLSISVLSDSYYR